MPKTIRIALTARDRAELERYLLNASHSPRLQERFEMVRLSDLGWSVPQIAMHLSTHEQTVRKYIKAFLVDGFEALPDRARSGRPPTITASHLTIIERKIAEWAHTGRRWTLADLALWLTAAHGVTISTGRLSALLQSSHVSAARPGRPASPRSLHPAKNSRSMDPQRQMA
ncbi:MAG: transposase [Chloroflexota bacterium]